MGQLRSIIASLKMGEQVCMLIKRYKDRILLLDVKDINQFKRIGLKFLAMEQLLEEHPEL